MQGPPAAFTEVRCLHLQLSWNIDAPALGRKTLAVKPAAQFLPPSFTSAHGLWMIRAKDPAGHRPRDSPCNFLMPGFENHSFSL